jgi:hypothetical protein
LKGANQVYTDGEFQSYVGQAFSGFSFVQAEFGRTLAAQQPTGLSATYFVRDLGVAVVTVNTATLTTGGLTHLEQDQSRLFLPERLIMEAISSAPVGVPILFMGHHPTGWLNEESASTADTIFAKHGVAYFCGHLHRSVPQQVTGISGSLFISQSGALFSSRSYWNGYGHPAASTRPSILFNTTKSRQTDRRKKSFAPFRNA